MPKQVTAHKSKGTKFKTTIASTLTDVAGMKNLKINFGENKTIEVADLDSTYEAPFDVDLTGAQGATFDLIYDPLGASQQDLSKAKNEHTERVGEIVLGATGVEIAVPGFYVTKFDVDAEVGNGLMASVEVKFSELVELNEVDPS
jgi:predicted secreted protein